MDIVRVCEMTSRILREAKNLICQEVKAIIMTIDLEFTLAAYAIIIIT